MSEFTDGVTAPEEQPQENAEQSTTEDYLAEFVGEGKKYQSVEEAAKALAKKAVNADTFIETLKTEKQELETKYNELSTKNRSIDEIIQAIKTPESNLEQQTPVQQEPEMSVDAIIAELEKRNQEKSEAEKRTERVRTTWERLGTEDVFGDMEKAKAAVATYIGDDTSKKALVDQLALVDPDGLITLLKQNKQVVTFTEEHNARSSENTTPVTGKLTWDIVNKIRKDNPELYNSKAFKNRMHHEL